MSTTVDRVPAHTAADVNKRIHDEMAERVQYLAANPERIPQRLKELDEEWDIERAIEANASALAFTGIALGATTDRRWLILPALVTAFCFNTRSKGGALRFRSSDGLASAPPMKSSRNGTLLRHFAAILSKHGASPRLPLGQWRRDLERATKIKNHPRGLAGPDFAPPPPEVSFRGKATRHRWHLSLTSRGSGRACQGPRCVCLGPRTSGGRSMQAGFSPALDLIAAALFVALLCMAIAAL